ncbi:hypothetical protein ACHAW5_010953 [Stephanodiscus triporus]|uniref:Kinesin light chain n=1 Tax=Stephanodiscus triporus TaxID=2934178 RepID=A0ABD3QX14_9STRA
MPSNAMDTAPPPPHHPPSSFPKSPRRSGLSLLRASSSPNTSSSSTPHHRRGNDRTTRPTTTAVTASGVSFLRDDERSGVGGSPTTRACERVDPPPEEEGEEEEDDDDDEGIDDDDDRDPLLSLFRAHNTNRVRFDLDSPSSVVAAAAAKDDYGTRARDRGTLRRRLLAFPRPSFPSGGGGCKRGGKTQSCLLSSSSVGTRGTTPLGRIGSFLEGRLASRGAGRRRRRGRSYGDVVDDEDGRAMLPSTADEELARLLRRASRAHRVSFRYRLAMRYYLLALRRITDSGRYAEDDPLASRVLGLLNDVHHAQSTLASSADIVRMGMQHEDDGMHVRALRMYTIAHRMRRDVLGRDHPSLSVLLNMMGSVQVKRGEHGEAMRLYELSLWGERAEDKEEGGGGGSGSGSGRGGRGECRHRNPLTTRYMEFSFADIFILPFLFLSVTLRDMGMILEHQGNEEKALRFYHASLGYALKLKNAKNEGERRQKSSSSSSGRNGSSTDDDDDVVGGGGGAPRKQSNSIGRTGALPSDNNRKWLDDIENGDIDEPFSLMEVRMAKSTKVGQSGNETAARDDTDHVAEDGEMELFLERRFDQWTLSKEGADEKMADGDESTKFFYDNLFLPPPPPATAGGKQSEHQKPMGGEESDIDIAMTLHQIGQIHRRSHRYAAALSAYNSSLRGMKEVLGTQHAIVAAILGNIGNLYMETGDYDEAFTIYQEVLGIETLQLGLSHPEVAVTLHNIATIECSRGNFVDGVSLYKQVVDMQKIRYGNEHITVAVTLSCLADAYEKLRNVNRAIKSYEEALKIRIAVLGKSHLDVGRLMHKLGRLASSRKDYAMANIYTTRASEIYEMNKLGPDHVFMCEMARDCADIRAQLAFAKK